MASPLITPAPARPQRDDLYTRYRGQLLSPERVRELSRLVWYRPVIDALWCWAWIVAAWSMVAVWPRWWTVALAVVVISTRFYALFIIAHDGFHRRLMNRAWVNDLFTDMAVLGAIGAITRLNSKNHLAHHRHLATPDDPDRHKYGCFNKFTRPQLLGYLTGVTSFVRSMRHVFLRREPPVADRADGLSKPAPATEGYRPRDVAILVAWQAALIAGLTLGIGLWAYPVLWLLPVFLAFVYDNLRSFCEHSQPEADAVADRHRLISYASHPLERLVVSPMNMNHHATHHLWPSIPYYRLAEADREIRRNPATAGLEWRGWYLAYLWRYLRRLPLAECGPAKAEPADGSFFTRWLRRRRPR